MDKPFPAYKGTGSYAFACYAHTDSDRVFSDLGQLISEGVNVWYDEGIQAGSFWRGEIATAIVGASKFLFFISKGSLASEHCLREVDYALNNSIEIIPVYLDDSSLPPELDLALNRVQALFRNDDSRYMEHLLEALRKGPKLAVLTPQKKNESLRLTIPILAVVIGLFLVYTWLDRGGPESAPRTADSVAQPAAFDYYLEGMELMERWDKDDNLEKAISNYRRAIEADPGFALAYARLAEALRMQFALTRDKDKLDEAVSNVNEALRINPDLAPVQVALGRIQASQGNMDLAFDALKQAVAIDPNDATANAALARLYERLGRMEDAEASFRKSVALDPENLLNIDSYANFLFRRGRYEEAVAQWQKVVAMAPDHYSALVNLGSAMSVTGRAAEAITLYQRAIEIKPTYMAWSNLGTASSRAGRYPEAIEAYEQALAIDDSDWLAWGNLAVVYSWMEGMEQEALETFEHAIRLAEPARDENPRDPYVHSDLAVYYAKTGNADLAQQRIETALSLSSDVGEILSYAAEVYELIGQRDKAVEMVRASLELGYPVQNYRTNPELKVLLAEMNI